MLHLFEFIILYYVLFDHNNRFNSIIFEVIKKVLMPEDCFNQKANFFVF